MKPGFSLRILQDLSDPKIRLGDIRDRILESCAPVRLIPDSEEIDDALAVN
ncbi:MAG: hypothetical protein LBV77_02425 [Candidatus Adiutrix intracellularis]|nr:hypothetical protein [Candidatus Adiutrix intracellularis]